MESMHEAESGYHLNSAVADAIATVGSVPTGSRRREEI